LEVRPGHLLQFYEHWEGEGWGRKKVLESDEKDRVWKIDEEGRPIDHDGNESGEGV